MNPVIEGLDAVLRYLRPALFYVALALAAIAGIDWLVRTRRINPFNPIARFARTTIDPLLKPVERSVLRAGGNPQSAPLWGLAFAVVGGIVVLSLLGFVRDQLLIGVLASQYGARGLGSVLLGWSFQILRLALLVTVICSWIRVSPYSKWVRWAFVLTEPFMRPLRRIVPNLGAIDISPLVAWLALGLLDSFLRRALLG